MSTTDPTAGHTPDVAAYEAMEATRSSSNSVAGIGASPSR